MNHKIQEFFEHDKIIGLADLQKTNRSNTAKYLLYNKNVSFFLIRMKTSTLGVHELSLSLEINEDLPFTAWANGEKVNQNEFNRDIWKRKSKKSCHFLMNKFTYVFYLASEGSIHQTY
ncbi:unnamed protein product [Lepeophtheirus salmonis]|uniref:(salmon louse) hypothetical protein n=1 Tax=Lepeophtheirus salmonis TaxID=72036 RepID=A0A7R8D134_LEPSM|nr:unnamed protein product [Lepeophtheirus salmonis]CAF2986027.1 unnamed protein product [Lepeophtheirus salmonis]